MIPPKGVLSISNKEINSFWRQSFYGVHVSLELMTFLSLPPSTGVTGAHHHRGNIFFFFLITKKTENRWEYSQGYTDQQMKLGFLKFYLFYFLILCASVICLHVCVCMCRVLEVKGKVSKKYPRSQHKGDYLPQTDKGQGIRNKDKQRGKETRKFEDKGDRAGCLSRSGTKDYLWIDMAHTKMTVYKGRRRIPC